MRALTLHQPWASLIAVGPKRIENRPWRPPQALLDGERLAIHAGKRYDEQAAAWVVRTFGAEALPADCPRGAVVAVVRVAGVVTRSTDPWFLGPFGWELADVRRAASPPIRGQQMLWRIDDSIVTVLS